MTAPPHYDPQANYADGEMPWTVFAYPKVLAESDLLPNDPDVRFLFHELRRKQLQLEIWQSPFNDSVYFACPYSQHEAVSLAISEIESTSYSPGFFTALCEKLFNLTRGGT